MHQKASEFHCPNDNLESILSSLENKCILCTLKYKQQVQTYIIYTRILWSGVENNLMATNGGRNKLGNWDWYIHMSMWKLLSRVQLFVTLWTVACQAPLSMGFSRQKYQSWLLFPPAGDIPNPGIEPRSPLTAGKSFTVQATREAHIHTTTYKIDN